jgi:hypothetical protein
MNNYILGFILFKILWYAFAWWGAKKASLNEFNLGLSNMWFSFFIPFVGILSHQTDILIFYPVGVFCVIDIFFWCLCDYLYL